MIGRAKIRETSIENINLISEHTTVPLKKEHQKAMVGVGT